MQPSQHFSVEGVIWNGLDRIAQRFIKNVDPIYEKLGLDKATVGAYGSRQSLHQYVAFFEVGAELTENPHFGLHSGGLVKAHRAGLPGQMCLYSKTLHDAILNLSSTLPTLIEGVEFSLIVDDPDALVLYRILDTKIESHHQFDDHALAFFTSMLRGMVGRNWAPKEVLFQHGADDARGPYKRIFKAPVKFDQPINAIRITRSDLALRGRHYNPFLLDTLAYYARKDVEQSKREKSLAEQVASLLEVGMSIGRADISHVAASLSMSAQTLQRRLKSEGVGFRELAEATRLDHACRYLTDSNLQISQIAERVGYSETSALSRAFQNSLGMSPSHYRRHMTSSSTDISEDG